MKLAKMAPISVPVMLMLIAGLQAEDNNTPKEESHPCDRACKDGETPMTCTYKFTVEWYHTLSKACKNCPFTAEDCSRPQCVAADGQKRALVTVNRQLPGPPITVCDGDTVVVALTNFLDNGIGTTIHWHGIHNSKTPHMDGASMVTQCPISPRSTFQYDFEADPPGTHFWHSHTGFQRSDGMSGAFIVRSSPEKEPHYALYDHDCDVVSGECEFAVIITDWLPVTGSDRELYLLHVSLDPLLPISALMNGKNGMIEVAHDKDPDAKGRTPFEVFDVVPGKRYRFRFISSVGVNCPFKLWVDEHKLTVIASDGSPVQPLEVDTFILVEGERYDFVLETDQPVGNYWVKAYGLMDCVHVKTKVFGILRYKEAPKENPPSKPSKPDEDRLGKILNPIELDNDFPKYYHGGEDDIYLEQLNYTKEENFTEEKVDVQHYLALDFLPNDAGRAKTLDPKTMNPHDVNVLQKGDQTPVINGISFLIQPTPFLTQLGDVNMDLVCDNSTLNKDYCYGDLCFCSHVLMFKLGQVVEIILYDVGTRSNLGHPMHMHGYAFRVLATGKVGDTLQRSQLEEMDKAGSIKRKLISPIYKDSVMVQDGGYIVLRFKADNPGVWLFHCHRESHALRGQIVGFLVGDPETFNVPDNMPRCGSWGPQTPKPKCEPNSSGKHTHCNSAATWCLLLTLIALVKF